LTLTISTTTSHPARMLVRTCTGNGPALQQATPHRITAQDYTYLISCTATAPSSAPTAIGGHIKAGCHASSLTTGRGPHARAVIGDAASAAEVMSGHSIPATFPVMAPFAKPMASQRPSWLVATAVGCAAELGTLLLGFGELPAACSKDGSVNPLHVMDFATLREVCWAS